MAYHQIITWYDIDTAPKDGTFILLRGDSGYMTTPFRVEVGRYYYKYWANQANDPFTDSGSAPEHWAPLPW